MENNIFNDRVTVNDLPKKPWYFWREQVYQHPHSGHLIIPTNDADWTFRCKVFAMACRKGYDDCPMPMPENHLIFDIINKNLRNIK